MCSERVGELAVRVALTEGAPKLFVRYLLRGRKTTGTPSDTSEKELVDSAGSAMSQLRQVWAISPLVVTTETLTALKGLWCQMACRSDGGHDTIKTYYDVGEGVLLAMEALTAAEKEDLQLGFAISRKPDRKP